MTEGDYRKILQSLDGVTRSFCSNQGELCECDLRIRALVSIAATEAERRLRSLERKDASAADSQLISARAELEQDVDIETPLRELRAS